MTLLVDGLLQFLNASPTPYHAVSNAKACLLARGFVPLDEKDAWHLEPGGCYFIERRNATLLAFKVGTQSPEKSGFRVVGAHTDSPTLKVKPNPSLESQGYQQLGVEVYGGALLAPWFDRDLSIAGRLTLRTNGEIQHKLVDFECPIAVIPSLAIHLDRTANSGREINPQTQMKPILLQDGEKDFKQILINLINKDGSQWHTTDILDFDLSFYDTQKASRVGLYEEFLTSARLDNLLSSYVGLQAFIDSASDGYSILALYDHEEVGSTSDIGANSNMLPALLERLVPDTEPRHRALANSLLVSVDNAHGVHPNFKHKHDDQHAPILNRGPVIKYDACQSYATSAETAGLVQWAAQNESVPVQQYVTRADMRCGSTIGPMSAAKTGIRAIDLGAATFAMHSIREMAGVADVDYLYAILKSVLKT